MRPGWRTVTTVAAIWLGAAAGPALAAGPTLAWSITVDDGNSPDDGARALAVDANGDVLVAGALGHQLAVVKRNGGTGAAVWQRQVAGAQSSPATRATSVAVHGGSVFAAASIAISLE